MCFQSVEVGVRLEHWASDGVTENRCEHNLQLPPSAKQHHQSWQALHRVAGWSGQTNMLLIFLCLSLSCDHLMYWLESKPEVLKWMLKDNLKVLRASWSPSLNGIEVIHACLILDPPLLHSAGKKDAKLAASILDTLKKTNWCARPPMILD